MVKHWLRPFKPVDQVASLLDHLKVSLASGFRVSLPGRVNGRDIPDSVLSPDLVAGYEAGRIK